jgi:hypothetical protein
MVAGWLEGNDKVMRDAAAQMIIHFELEDIRERIEGAKEAARRAKENSVTEVSRLLSRLKGRRLF